jgi:pyruvate dehydrogenase E2 component (dihydrolipoamide acetyltransferase)
MSTDIVMPQMGESIFEGTITKWFKKPGDRVERDEPLFEISTDKVDAEIPSPTAGVLSEIKVQEGATVGINTVVAVVSDISETPLPATLTTAGETASTPAADGTSSVAAPAAVPSATSSFASADRIDVVMPQMGESIFEGTITRWYKKAGDAIQKDEPLFEISTDKVDAEIPSPAAGVLGTILVAAGMTVGINTVVATIQADGAAAVGPAGASSETDELAAVAPAREATRQAAAPEPVSADAVLLVARTDASVRLRSSPLVRRMAREHRLDLESITGSGSGGRITKEDVVAHLSRQASDAVAAATTNGGRRSPEAAASPLPGNLAPLSRMRSIIADRMVESRAASPHVYFVYKIDMTRIARLRERERGGFEQRHGVKLTWMPFIATAVVEALRRHPIVNASLLTTPDRSRSIQYHPHIHLGIAVALEWGLIVPVVRGAETLSFVELARTMADLAARARAKKLQPEEASGSTFTLTNAGVFGGEFGTPIINQPESAILAIGGLKKEPVVITDAEGGDTIAIRSMQSYCLGFDHRLIDGADGGKFMTVFQQTLEGWDRPIG